MKAAILVFMVATISYPQTAKVIALSPEDAAQAKSLYEQKAAIEKKIVDFQAKIDDKYTMVVHNYPTSACITGMSVTHKDGTEENLYVPPCVPLKVTPEQEKASHVREHEFGWQYGFEFSEDYKFIVPKTYSPPQSVSCFWANPAYTNNAVTN